MSNFIVENKVKTLLLIVSLATSILYMIRRADIMV